MATATLPETRTDEQIQREVLAELKWDARIQPNEIGVIVKDGVVTLTGWVDSYAKKWAAEDAAHRVRGVKAVANDVEVRLPSSAERTDAERVVRRLSGVKGVSNLIVVKPRRTPSPDELKEKIAEALVRSVKTDAERITVEVQGTKVILKGTVRSWAEKQEAERAAWLAPGVTSVDNRIMIEF